MSEPSTNRNIDGWREPPPVMPPEILPPAEDLAQQSRMQNRIRVLVAGQGEIGQPLVDRVETTTVGQDGMEETTDIVMTFASGDGFVMHAAAEAGAVCADSCGRLMSASFAANRANLCVSCGRPVAGPCQRRPMLAGEGEMYCRTCYRRWWSRELVVLAVVLGGVLLVGAVLLSFIRGCASWTPFSSYWP